MSAPHGQTDEMIETSGLLSDASLDALQLRQQPFAEYAADGDHFADDTTAEQLADIKQALITGDDLLLILGEDGAGKSTLLAQLGANSGLRIQCFSVRGSERFSTHNLFAGMLEAFKQTPADDLKDMLDALVPSLQGMVGKNILSAIVLDNADQVSDVELTRLLSGMLYLNSQDDTLMRVALAAHEQFEARIPELLPEGADLPYSSLSIESLTDDRAAAYLDFRLNQAGYFDPFPFTDRDIENLNEQAAGLPARLHVAAANELNARHGVLDSSAGALPPELVTATGGGAGMGKFALGALALALILGGLMLFKPKQDVEDDSTRFTVVEERPVETVSAVADASNALTSEPVPEPEPVPAPGRARAGTRTRTPASTGTRARTRARASTGTGTRAGT